MGGSPSTGSSLLVNILNRHSMIFAGSETYFFLHRQLQENWSEYKGRLLQTGKVFGLKSPAWFVFNGVLSENKDYGWSREELEGLVRESQTYEEYVERFFSRPVVRDGKTTWIEKSPANSFNFKFFADRYPDAKFIQVIRNPYDTAASLMKRGHDAWYCAGRCLFSNARALGAADLPNYYAVSYENLVVNPEQELSGLLRFLGLSEEVNLPEPQEEEKDKVVQMQGWQHNEYGKIGKSSVGRFQKLPKEEQKLLRAAFSAFELSEKYVIDPRLRRAEDIFARLGYEYKPEKVRPFKEKLHEQRTKDMIKRTLRLYPTGIGNYLADIRY